RWKRSIPPNPTAHVRSVISRQCFRRLQASLPYRSLDYRLSKRSRYPAKYLQLDRVGGVVQGAIDSRTSRPPSKPHRLVTQLPAKVRRAGVKMSPKKRKGFLEAIHAGSEGKQSGPRSR